MSDTLYSPRRRLCLAKERIEDLKREIAAFWRGNPYVQVIEDDPQRKGYRLYKIKLVKELPASIADIACAIAGHLRSALDQAGYAVALAAAPPGTKPKRTAFPFAGSEGHMNNSLGRCQDLPQEIRALFCTFKPYKGGDDLLWALNTMRNTNEHMVLVPVSTVVQRPSTKIRGTGFFQMTLPEYTVWDRCKQEVTFLTLGPGATFPYDFAFEVV